MVWRSLVQRGSNFAGLVGCITTSPASSDIEPLDWERPDFDHAMCLERRSNGTACRLARVDFMSAMLLLHNIEQTDKEGVFSCATLVRIGYGDFVRNIEDYGSSHRVIMVKGHNGDIQCQHWRPCRTELPLLTRLLTRLCQLRPYRPPFHLE